MNMESDADPSLPSLFFLFPLRSRGDRMDSLKTFSGVVIARKKSRSNELRSLSPFFFSSARRERGSFFFSSFYLTFKRRLPFPSFSVSPLLSLVLHFQHPSFSPGLERAKHRPTAYSFLPPLRKMRTPQTILFFGPGDSKRELSAFFSSTLCFSCGAALLILLFPRREGGAGR